MARNVGKIFRRPRRHFLASLSLLLLLGLFIWAAGLVWYADQVPRSVRDADSKTDAIVVLTGGSGRLQQGLELLAEARAGKLFVSGVYRGVDVRHLLKVFQESRALQCCVDLGYEADDTRGNATETAAWMRAQKFTSLRLVTSAYHMPRSLLEFRRTMPAIAMVPHPVFAGTFKRDDWWRWPGSARLVISEYHKYLAAVLLEPLRRPPL